MARFGAFSTKSGKFHYFKNQNAKHSTFHFDYIKVISMDIVSLSLLFFDQK
jgi:hypothetical protein